MSLSTQPYKGARDFYPEDKRTQKFMFNIWRKVAEQFGYEEYDAPILESLELYRAKSGEEIVNDQTYSFIDRGDREVVIRPEMTPSVSRMVAGRRQELGYPLRWYSIPNLWRYERPQRGRLREHWQLNVDLFGIDNIYGEHELILLADSIMKQFKAEQSMYEFHINNRKLMDYIMHEFLGLDGVQSQTLSKLIDRMHKIPYQQFVADCDAMFTPTQRETGISDKLIDILRAKSLDDLPETIQKSDPAMEVRVLLDLLADSGVNNAFFDITVMRGFDYYTGIVFEMFDTDPENNRAMMGGGRYNGLVGLFGVDPVATVGFGWGDVTLANFLTTNKLIPHLNSETEIYMAIVGDNYQKAQKLLKSMREEGVTIAVDATDRKPASKIKAALKKNIRYIVFVGDKELEENRYNLKDLHTEKEKNLSPERLISAILDERNQD